MNPILFVDNQTVKIFFQHVPLSRKVKYLLFSGMEETFDKVEAARDQASTAAMKSIKEASLRVARLMEQVITAAADEDRTGDK